MVTIISGTNREKSETLKVCKYYSKKLTSAGVENQIFDLADLPEDFVFSALYGKQNEVFNNQLQKYIFDVQKLVIISPEYNGSFPGILKSCIDGWNPKETPGKWVALVGVASGRQGNARGMDDLTNVLNYLKMNVVPVKLPVSQIYKYFNENGDIEDEELNKLFDAQIQLLKEA